MFSPSFFCIIMEVTRHNFKQILPEVEKSIEDCLFMSIDAEFTGLTGYGCHRISPMDVPETRYYKLRETVQQFLLIQFGLSTFYYDGNLDSYTYRAFNFYVCPRPCIKGDTDRRFTCQSSSLHFLADQNFDFNKLFRDGISFLLLKDVSNIRDRIQHDHISLNSSSKLRSATTSESSPIVLSTEDNLFLGKIRESIKKWQMSETNLTPLQLDIMSSYKRMLIYQVLKPEYSDLYFETEQTTLNTRSTREKAIFVYSESSADNLLKQSLEKELTNLEESVGFSRVIKKIISSGKKIVGHNCALDICFIIQQFIEPLPADYEEFKLLCLAMLPNVVDTKLIASTEPLSSEIEYSSLEAVFHTVWPSTKSDAKTNQRISSITPQNENEGYDLGAEKFHEAGYDALITGICYIAMVERLASMSHDKDSFQPNVFLTSSPLVLQYTNKLFMMRMVDVPYMNLSGPDIVPDRSHIFHVSFPPEWKLNDLTQLFNEFDPLLNCPIYVNWVDSTSAFVALKQREMTLTINKALKNQRHVNRNYMITSYASYIMSSTAYHNSCSSLTTEKKRPCSPELKVVLDSRIEEKPILEHSITKKKKAVEVSNAPYFGEPAWD